MKRRCHRHYSTIPDTSTIQSIIFCLQTTKSFSALFMLFFSELHPTLSYAGVFILNTFWQFCLKNELVRSIISKTLSNCFINNDHLRLLFLLCPQITSVSIHVWSCTWEGIIRAGASLCVYPGQHCSGLERLLRLPHFCAGCGLKCIKTKGSQLQACN